MFLLYYEYTEKKNVGYVACYGANQSDEDAGREGKASVQQTGSQGATRAQKNLTG